MSDQVGGDADTFICGRCGGTFGKGWTEEEAWAEAKANFGNQLVGDLAYVCDPCYQIMTAEFPIAEYLRYIAHLDEQEKSVDDTTS